MVTQEMIDKSREECRELHDLIKNNPFWIDFNYKYLKGLLDLYRDLLRKSWTMKYMPTRDGKTNYNRSNPYGMICRCITHDTNAMISWIMWDIEKDDYAEIEKYKGEIVQVLQTCLSNIHCLIDEMSLPKDTCAVGYTFSKKSGMCKFKSFWDYERNGWYAYNVIPKEKIPKIKLYLEEYAKLGLEKFDENSCTRSTIQWARAGLQDIESGKKIIADQWLIED